MAYFSLHAYDADVFIPGFMGLNQSDVGMVPDMRFAANAVNVETPNGVLQPQASIETLEGEFEGRVETLASFVRRWYTGEGNNRWYVCSSGGKLYQKQAGNDSGWIEINLPSGVTAYQSSEWSCVNYEITEGMNPTVDVLLMSNATDGMIMVIPPDRPTTHDDLAEFTHEALSAKTHDQLTTPVWNIRTVDTQGYRFGVIERFNERIWGGNVNGQPDTLVYSRPYNPLDWTLSGDDEQPEDGAGSIDQPSWDGDRFFALKRFGDQLLAFKKNAIWRVMGTNPGEFMMSQQYGSGTEYPKTIAVDRERVFMESRGGLTVYDGMSSSGFAQEMVEQLWRSVNFSALGECCATLFKDRYYVAFPVDGSSVNNAMLVYNLKENTILYYPNVRIEAFMPTDDELFVTSSDLPGRILKINYDSWVSGKTSGEATLWITPWMDFGRKSIQKGGFDLYFIPEVQDEPVTLVFTVQTEKKTKTKRYTVLPLTAEQREKHKEHRGKRLHFGGSGRKFRLTIETEAGVTAPWRLVGGIQMIVETDPD